MKKVIVSALFLVAIIVIVLSVQKNCNKGPYVGRYECPKNNSILILSKDSTCTIVHPVYKEAFYIKGKYFIKNNEIKLMLNEGAKENLDGEIEGNMIKFNDFYKNSCSFYLEK